MEFSLLDSKSVTASEIIGKGRSDSIPFSSFKHVIKSFPRFSSGKGILAKVSCSTASRNSCLSSNVFIPPHHLLAETCAYSLNGNHGAVSKLFSKTMGILDATDDEYGGVVINPERLPANPDAFASSLRHSVSHWKNTGKKGIWLKLPLELSELVPFAVKAGFVYHHAERGYVMLTHWIHEGPCMLPANASHQVGVGGFAMNEQNEVLVVQEKFCAPSIAGLWKLPTGFILESEEIFTGAVREVKEETGVDTEFIEVIAFRHAHKVAFGKSDLFFICMLRPLSTEIRVDDLEIQAAKWMPLVEFVQQPLIRGDSMFSKIIDICIARMGKRYCGLSVNQVISMFDGKQSSLYCNVIDSHDVNCIGS